MRRLIPISRRFLTVFLILAMLLSAAAAESLFPKPDELFGVTMPDVRFALDREADSVTQTEEGKVLAYDTFSVADYDTFGRYAAAEGLTFKEQNVEDNVLTVMLSKDGAMISLRYSYAGRKASVIYPEGTRLEKKAAVKSSAKGSILPDLRYIFGIAIPELSAQLPLHPSAKTVREEGLDVIRYTEVSRKDYETINRHLTALGYTVLEWHASDGVLYATITAGTGAVTLRYELQEQCFSLICPELYYLDGNRSAESAAAADLILPDLQVAMGAILPRISTAVLRYPSETEETADGYRETYLNFSGEDYTAFSAYLTDKGCEVGQYYVNDFGELVIPLTIGASPFTFIYDQVGGRAIAEYPAGSQLEPEFASAAVATPTPKPTAKPTAAPKPTVPPKNYTADECWEIAYKYFENLGWKNPSSLQVHDYTQTTSEDGYLFFIDYSAMNGFGGYNRETYMIKVNWTTGQIEYAFSY